MDYPNVQGLPLNSTYFFPTKFECNDTDQDCLRIDPSNGDQWEDHECYDDGFDALCEISKFMHLCF